MKGMEGIKADDRNEKYESGSQ
ncbi:unnamed protein product, partial [Didymodactylos carnosus]